MRQENGGFGRAFGFCLKILLGLSFMVQSSCDSPRSARITMSDSWYSPFPIEESGLRWQVIPSVAIMEIPSQRKEEAIKALEGSQVRKVPVSDVRYFVGGDMEENNGLTPYLVRAIRFEESGNGKFK